MKGALNMSYEKYRHEILIRISDKLPAKLLNDIMHEIDSVSVGYKIDKSCTDLITVDSVPEMVKIYIASMAVENCKPKTLKEYKNILIAFFGSVRKPYTAVETNDIRHYLFSEQTRRSWIPETVEHHRIVINAFFNWLVNNEYMNRNPAKPIKPAKLQKKKAKPLNQIELETFRSACVTSRERALVDFLFATGCRVTETHDVLLSDINWYEHSVIVRHGKGDKERVTYLNAEAEISIKRYLSERNGADDHLFVSGRFPYLGLSSESLEKEIRNIRERIPEHLSVKVTPHTFRRTMGTLAVRRGCPIEQVKELLGHESLDTTMKYVTVDKDEVKHSHQKYLAG